MNHVIKIYIHKGGFEMHKKKKMFLYLLALVLALTVAACQQTSQNAGTDQPTSSPSSPAATENQTGVGDMSKTLEIAWSGWLSRGKSKETNKVQQMLEKKFNVKLINPQFDNINSEQVNLMLASGELPDVTLLRHDPFKLHGDQLTRTIPRELIETYAPNYAAMLSSNPVGWKLNQLPGKDNEYVALTGSVDWYKNLFWLQTYRLDWLEKVGIQPKGELIQLGETGDAARTFFTTEAFTIAEEEQIFDAFVNNDPDGNGQKDTFAVSRSQNGDYSYQTWAGAFGFAWGQNVEENGKLVEYNISLKYKEFLQKQAEWYAKGYIDPEFPTLNHIKGWEKYGTGIIGVAVAGTESAGLPSYTYNRPPNNLLAKDPTAKILYAPPPIGPHGDQGSGGLVQIRGDTFTDNMIIRKDVSDEKLIRILQILEYISFDQEAYIFTNFGEEGIDFDWEGEPGNSAYIARWTEPENNELGIGLYNHIIRPEDKTVYWVPQSQYKIFELYAAHTEVIKNSVLGPYKVDRFNQTEVLDIKAKYGAGLNTISEEFFYRAVTGEINIEAEWDAYVNNWLSSGGSELLAELEKAPKASDLESK